MVAPSWVRQSRSRRTIRARVTTCTTSWCGFNGLRSPTSFGSPNSTIVAYDLSEVLPAIAQVESAVRLGFYALGFVTYEASPAFDDKMETRAPTPGLPLVWFVICDKKDLVQEEWVTVKRAATDNTSWNSTLKVEWKASQDFGAYSQSFMRVREALRNGDSYQVNLAMRLWANISSDDRSINDTMDRLLKAQRGGYGAFLDTGRFKVVLCLFSLFAKRVCI